MKKNTISNFSLVDDYPVNDLNQSDDNSEISNRIETNLITLNIYFCGTGAKINDATLLVGLMYKHTIEDKNNLKMGFDGCAFDKNGDISISGALFGTGINEQCKKVIAEVTKLIEGKKQVKLIILGHDRGAIAAAKLAKLLGNFDKDILEINMVLLDAVPGNSTLMYKLDLFGTTLATQAQDLRDCRNLSHVLSLYSNISAPLFAPLIFKYPSNCRVSEDVTPGDHHNIQEISQYMIDKIVFRPRSYICFFRIKTFFEGCGTTFKFAVKLIIDTFPKTELEIIEDNSNRSRINIACSSYQEYDQVEKHEALLICYEMELQDIKKKISKKCHTNENIYIQTCPNDVNYVNYHHRQLAESNPSLYRQLVESNPSISNINFHKKNFALYINHPLKILDETINSEFDPNNISMLFKQLIEAVKAKLSLKSQQSPKSSIINAMLSDLRLDSFDNFGSIIKIKIALRNFIAIVLQENDVTFSNKYTSSGRKLLAMINTVEYKFFANLILGSCSGPVTYNDLRQFVIGNGDKDLFNSNNKKFMYNLFQAKSDVNINALTENRFTSYFSFKK